MGQSPLNSDQLEAFEAVARLQNFTAAAEELRLTQPALSRRIRALEDQLKTNLFLRKSTGVELTDAGCRLRRFAEAKGLLEKELRADLTQSGSSEPMGVVRIAGYTSVLHEVVTPSIAPFLRDHARVMVHYQATQNVKPAQGLADLLLRADTDLLLSVTDLSSRDLVGELLGRQELLAVESTQYPTRSDVYLDTRPEDTTTVEFFKVQNSIPQKYQRSFLYDEDGILNAVMQGLGRAVVFRSLIKDGMPLRQVRGSKPMSWKLYLNYRKQPYSLPSVDGIRKALLKSASEYLR